MDKENDSRRVTSLKVITPSGRRALRGINESFKERSFTGSGGFSIPFPLPGARDSPPTINLSYNSGSGYGLSGLGFSVALDSVARKTSDGIFRYNDTEVFILNSAGKLLLRYTDSKEGWVKAPPEQAWSHLLSRRHNAYWNNDGNTVLSYGGINALALLHHEETAARDPDEIKRSFWDKVNDELR
ncbi:SpvB/TcaC N-terminal domain-containing protein [Compostibacter hankyongensis]